MCIRIVRIYAARLSNTVWRIAWAVSSARGRPSHVNQDTEQSRVTWFRQGLLVDCECKLGAEEQSAGDQHDGCDVEQHGVYLPYTRAGESPADYL